MAQRISIQHKDSKIVKNTYYGFSWTYLLFGPFVPLIRGEYALSFLYLLLSVLVIPHFFLAFKYNQISTNKLLSNGWVLAGSEGENKMAEKYL